MTIVDDLVAVAAFLLLLSLFFFEEENVSISISFHLPIRVFAIKLDFHV